MLSRRLRTHLVVAPTTESGKSLASVALLRASSKLGERPAYLKPVGTGDPDAGGDDEQSVCVTVTDLHGGS